MSVDYDWSELREAKALGISYGKYKAMHYHPEQAKPSEGTTKRPSRRKKKRYTDQEAFRLWQEGKTDSEIAATLGVSRALIQRWRDILELPAITRNPIDTSKYYLQQSEDGNFYAIKDDEL